MKKKDEPLHNAETEKVLTCLSNGLTEALAPLWAQPKTGSASGVVKSANSNTPRLADLLDEIAHTITCYVKLPKKELAVLIALWLAGTYCYQLFRYFGYLAKRSATARCGKTTLLRIESQLANGSPPITSMPTPAVLFRSSRPVLLLDEVDKLRNADKEKYGEVLAVLNAGFEQGGIVERCEGKSHEVKQFFVYGPKALAGIEGIADTLADRSFQVQMERSPQRMPRLNLRKMNELFTQLREGMQRWMDEHEKQIVEAYDSLPDELDALKKFDDRFQDISEPLVVLATLADAERPNGPKVLPRLLEGLNAAVGQREPSGRERQLLAFLDIAASKLGTLEDVFVRSVELVADCAVIEDLAFIETPKKLSGLLAHFDLSPRSNGHERGYDITREWVEKWKSRYVKPTP